MSDAVSEADILDITARIVSAHVTFNAVPAESLPALIVSIYNTLASVDAVAVEPDQRQPAVPIRRSIFPGYLVCLEDGKHLVMLKRHLRTAYAMTPAQYRERWGLPDDYPMVAPNYAERRSALAKTFGLGRKRTDSLSAA